MTETATAQNTLSKRAAMFLTTWIKQLFPLKLVTTGQANRIFLSSKNGDLQANPANFGFMVTAKGDDKLALLAFGNGELNITTVPTNEVDDLVEKTYRDLVNELAHHPSDALLDAVVNGFANINSMTDLCSGLSLDALDARNKAQKQHFLKMLGLNK